MSPMGRTIIPMPASIEEEIAPIDRDQARLTAIRGQARFYPEGDTAWLLAKLDELRAASVALRQAWDAWDKSGNFDTEEGQATFFKVQDAWSLWLRLTPEEKR